MLSKSERKEIIRTKLANIKNLMNEYEILSNINEIKNYEITIEENFKQLEYEFPRKLPLKYFGLQQKFEELKKEKKFINFPCVRCSSTKNMTYYTRTKKRHSSSSYRRNTATYQVFEFDFPVCQDCKKNHRPKSFTKIKTKYLGHSGPGWAKNFEGIPMVKPANSDKWITYESWLHSL
jgi:hypothetical protein